MKMGRYLIIGIVLIAFAVTFVDRGLIDNFRMKERLTAMKRVNADLAKENEELEKKNVLLRNDLSYIETVARNELGMVRKGDVVFQFEK